MIKLSENVQRDLFVDGSLYGMGKSAGNAPLELIAMYINHLYHQRYSIYQMLEAIDSSIINFYSDTTWGYNLFYFIAAFNDCHPNYVSFLLKKNTLSVKSVNDILQTITPSKALQYDEDYIEKKYIDYQNNEINDEDDVKRLKKIFYNKNVLIIGPGLASSLHESVLNEYVEHFNPIVISINCIPNNIHTDYIFLCNAKRYIQLASKLSKSDYKIIATSNLTKTGKNNFEFTLNYASLLEEAPIVADSAIIMLIKLLSTVSCSTVALAGLEGYTKSTALKFSTENGADKIVNISDYINNYISNIIYSKFNSSQITFLTRSRFEIL